MADTSQQSKLKLINFDLADIYFPLFVIQVNWDVFPLRNRNYRQVHNQTANVEQVRPDLQKREEEDLAIVNHDMMREQYE